MGQPKNIIFLCGEVSIVFNIGCDYIWRNNLIYNAIFYTWFQYRVMTIPVKPDLI